MGDPGEKSLSLTHIVTHKIKVIQMQGEFITLLLSNKETFDVIEG